jgi:hypothetical protein
VRSRSEVRLMSLLKHCLHVLDEVEFKLKRVRSTTSKRSIQSTPTTAG